MTETTRTHATNGHARSALGRLTMLVDVEDGTEKVTYERRWPDAHAARRWCEGKVAEVTRSTAVVEILVTEEVWGHQHAWEATAERHIPETLQLGLRARSGEITWGAALPVGNDMPPRRH